MNRHYSHISKDHLGNIRSVVRKYPDSGDVTELQKTHYYPFGGIIADISTGRNVQSRLYNGKEHITFAPRENGDIVGGETINNRDITMNSNLDSSKNRNHELGHTLGLEHPKGSGTSGLMGYPPTSQNQTQINKLGNSKFLKTVIP